MLYERIFADLIRFLKESKTIAKIFDVDSVDLITYGCMDNYRRFSPEDFYAGKLPDLMMDVSELTHRDYYDDKEFRNISNLIREIGLNKNSENGSLRFFISNNIELAAKVYVLLMMFLCTGYMEFKSHSSSSLAEYEERFKLKNNLNKELQYFWYRGVTNIDEHDLIPSMYRNIKEKYVHIDDAYIDDLYNINHFKREFDHIFGSTTQDEFFAYMQHSTAYSPLIDFTKKINVAGSFATSFTNATDFKNIDAGIYLLVRKNSKNNGKYSINIELFNELLTPFSVIFKKPLLFCTLGDFYVRYSIIDQKSNDRMKYQDGLFVKIYHAVFVKGKLLFPDSTSSLFILRIPYKGRGLTKDKIIDDIETNHKEYTYDYLMDPYKWFSKRHK